VGGEISESAIRCRVELDWMTLGDIGDVYVFMLYSVGVAVVTDNHATESQNRGARGAAGCDHWGGANGGKYFGPTTIG
jgi:hypothetical protein